MLEVADSLSNMENGAEKTAIAIHAGIQERKFTMKYVGERMGRMKGKIDGKVKHYVLERSEED